MCSRRGKENVLDLLFMRIVIAPSKSFHIKFITTDGLVKVNYEPLVAERRTWENAAYIRTPGRDSPLIEVWVKSIRRYLNNIPRC